jgi:hypothetical protein
VYQIQSDREHSSRHELPTTLGGRVFMDGETYSSSLDKILSDWRMSVTRISDAYPLERFQNDRPQAVIIATLDEKAQLKFVPNLDKLSIADGVRVIHFSLPLSAHTDRQGAPQDTI